MAEAFFRKYGGDLLDVDSAGLEPAGVNPFAVKVMAEIGIDISGQRSKSVREFLGKSSVSHVIAVCKKAEGNCPVIFPAVRYILSWPFDDPAGFEGPEEAKLLEFGRVRDQIETRIQDWLADYRASRR
jgi:arsenate reductase